MWMSQSGVRAYSSTVVSGFRGDTMFDADYPIRFAKLVEVMFHDTQLFFGGVHTSYQELMTLPEDVRKKMYLYHYGDNWDKPET